MSALLSSVRRRYIARHLQQCTTYTYPGRVVYAYKTSETGKEILESVDETDETICRPIPSCIVNFQGATNYRKVVRVMKQAVGIPWYFPSMFMTTGRVLEDVHEAFKMLNQKENVFIFEHLEALALNPALHRSLCELFRMINSGNVLSRSVACTANGDDAYSPYFRYSRFNELLSRNDAIEFLYKEVRDIHVSWNSSDLRVLGEIIDKVGTDQEDLMKFADMAHMLWSLPHIIANIHEAQKERLQQALIEGFVNVDYVSNVLNSLPVQYSRSIFNPWAFVTLTNPSIKYLLDMEFLAWDKQTQTLDFRLPTIRHSWSTIHHSIKSNTNA